MTENESDHTPESDHTHESEPSHETDHGHEADHENDHAVAHLRPRPSHHHPHHDHPHHGHGHPHAQHHEGGRGWRARAWHGIRHILVPHSHDAHAAIQSAEESTREGIRTAWIGLAGMMATAFVQVVIVALSGSIALLADTIHNLGHAATTIPLILAFRLGRRPASSVYTYGYRRAEDLVGLFISVVIVASIVLIVWESVQALISPRPLTNLGWVFAAGIVGFAGNEAVAVYRIRTGRRIGSAALIAEGQHARADGYTSIAVVIGVVGVWFGFERADAIAGLLIAVAITGILIGSLRMLVRRLMDGIEPATIDTMRTTAGTTPGVVLVGRIRARWLGHRIEADAEIGVAAGLRVHEAHEIAERVEHALLHAVPSLDRVTVHVHPTHDGEVPENLHAISEHHLGGRLAHR